MTNSTATRDLDLVGSKARALYQALAVEVLPANYPASVHLVEMCNAMREDLLAIVPQNVGMHFPPAVQINREFALMGNSGVDVLTVRTFAKVLVAVADQAQSGAHLH